MECGNCGSRRPEFPREQAISAWNALCDRLAAVDEVAGQLIHALNLHDMEKSPLENYIDFGAVREALANYRAAKVEGNG